jgi:hypothetical protein
LERIICEYCDGYDDLQHENVIAHSYFSPRDFAPNHSYRKRIIEEYGKEKTQAQLESFLGFLFDRFLDEGAIAEAEVALFNEVYTYIDVLNATEVINFSCIDFLDADSYRICDIDDNGFYDCSNLQSATDALCALTQNPEMSVDDPALQAALLNASGFGVTQSTELIKENLASAISAASASLYPEYRWMVTVPFGIGIAVAVLNALVLFMSYLPSVTATIIELRTGVIPSLKDKSFEKYRIAPDTVTMLTGSLFWGALVSSILFGLIVASIAFILVWQGSRVIVQRLVTIVIGLAVIILIRLSCIACCKAAFFNGLYRKRPAGANISFMALEWANYIFTTAFILIRMVKLILTATVRIGRIDRPFLAKGVGNLGPLELDPYPTIHTRDLVAHEAHRHPYIEVLGVLYLMKLRYADLFCTRVGSAWRLLFVYGLMPWLHTYRIHEGQILEDMDDNVEDFAEALGRTGLRSSDSSGLARLATHRSSEEANNNHHLAILHGHRSDESDNHVVVHAEAPSDALVAIRQTDSENDQVKARIAMQRLESENERLKALLLQLQSKLDEKGNGNANEC